MKKFATWLNEAQSKRLLKRTDSLDTTPYRHIKRLLLADMGEEDPYDAHIIRTRIVFGYAIYSLVAVTLILIGA